MNENCENCPYANEIKNLRKDVDNHSSRITDAEKQIIIMQERFNNLLSGQKDIKTIVEEIRDKPAKRWDSVTMYAVTCIVGLVLGYIFSLVK